MILWEMDPVLDNPRLFLSQYLQVQPNRLTLTARPDSQEDTHNTHNTHNTQNIYNVFISPASSVLDWIDEDCLDSLGLCENRNPKVVDYLRHHPEQILCFALNANPVCTDFVFEQPEHIDLKWLCKNPHPRAVQYTLEHIERNPNPLYIQQMCSNTNPDIIRFLTNPECLPHLNWVYLSLNECPEVVSLFEQFPERVIWSLLAINKCEQVALFGLRHLNRMAHNMNVWCSNPCTAVVEFLLNHREHIQFVYFSSNSNDKAVDALLSVFYDQVCWETFAQNKNPRAIQYIYDHLHLVKPIRLWYLLLEQGEHGVPFWMQHLEDIRELLHHIAHSSNMMTASWMIPMIYEFRHSLARKKSSWFTWYCLSKNPGIFM